MAYRLGRIFIISISFLCFLSMFNENNSFAVNKPSGDAVYRDGVFINIYEHAGIFKSTNRFFQIAGSGEEVTLSTQEDFVDDKTFIRWREVPGISTTVRDYILTTASALDAEPGITYVWYDMINYYSNPGTYLEVAEISEIRCDGVVEYAYEWNNIWIWGKSSNGTSTGVPTNFDVSIVSNVSAHNIIGANNPWVEVSPQVQRGGANVSDPWYWTKLRIDTSLDTYVFSENKIYESAHPYTNNYLKTWTITKKAASKIRVHFSSISTEQNYDVITTNAGDSFSGDYSSGVWSSWKTGSSINITLSTDVSLTDYGFRIDRIEYQN